MRRPRFTVKNFLIILFVAFSVPASAHAAIVKPANNLGLVGYWNLDEGRGSTAYTHGAATSTGNATLFNSPTWTTGKLGKALTFGASSNYASTSLAWPSNGGSISLWAYPTAYGDWISPAGWKLLGTNNGFILIDNGGGGSPGKWRAVFNPNVSSGPGEVDAIALQNDTLNAWQYLTMTWSLSGSTYTVHLYVNGVDQGSATWTGTPGAAGVGSFHFGNSGDYPDNYFAGKVDDVRVYNRPLSAGEVAAFYNQTAGTKYNSSLQSSANGSTLNQGLVSRWTMDGADVTDKVYDRIGGNNGYFVGSATSTAKVQGKLGQALNFNGSSSYVEVADSSSLDSNVGSVSFWAKIPAASAGNGYFLIGKADAVSSLNGYSIFSYNGNFSVQLKNNSTSANLTDSRVTTDNKWHHVVLTYQSGNTSKLYVDGVQADSQTAPSGISITSQVFRIGKSNDSYWQLLNGSIDDVRIYNRALSASEVAQLYEQGGGKINAPASTLTNGTTLGASGGLVSYWSFNGADVTDKVYDRVGGNNGYFYNGATSTAKAQGKLGQAMSFNGTNQYVQIANSSSLNISGTVTLSAWVYPTAFAFLNGIISKYNTPSGNEYFLRLSGSAPYNKLDCGGSTDFTSTGTLSLNKWYHVVCVLSGGSATIYINGVQDSSGSAAFSTNTDPVVIGADYISGGRYWAGKIDEVRVYNRALSASEVQSLYNLGK